MFFFLSLSVSAQTYSKIYELGKNVDLIDNGRSTLRSMIVHNENIFIHTDHICDPDTTDNMRAFCTGVYKFSKDGDLVKNILFDSIFPLGNNRIALGTNNLYVSGHKHDNFDTSYTVLKKLDFDLNELSSHNIGTHLQKSIFNNGIITYGESLYSYGKNFRDDQTEESHLQKINSEMELVDEFRFSKGLSFNDCLDLQPTADGNLIYINDWSDGVGAQPTGSQIIVIDTDGNPLDSLTFNDYEQYTDVGRVLLASSNGDVYCFSERNPSGQTLQSHGRINKYDKDLDTMLWSTELPFNNFTNARRYKALNMVEAKNGDILVCGTVFDEGPDGPIANGYDHAWNGFITRLDTDGNILWLRLYKTDNNSPLIPKDEYGKFLNSTIWNMHELDDGRIITGGTSYHTNWQNGVITPAGETNFYTWLMTVNADGCLDGEECDEVIILDGEYRPKDGYLPIINSNQYWIWQTVGGNSPSSYSRLTFGEDSVSLNTNYYFPRFSSTLSDGSNPQVSGYFREIEGKLYKKLEGNFNEEMILDMSMIVGDTLDQETLTGNKLVVAKVDTVTYLDGIPRKRIDIRCEDNPEWFSSFFWVEGIGRLSTGEQCILDGGENFLRCVLSLDDERIYSAINEDSDCWVETNVSDRPDISFSIYPNPISEDLNIELDQKIQNIEVISPDGIILDVFENAKTIDLTHLQRGIYFIKIYTDKGIGVRSFVKQ